MQAEDDTPHVSIALDPLTRTNRAGDVYVRTPQVEGQITEALAMAPEAMRSSLAIDQPGAPDFLSEECLVYLLRHYVQHGDSARVNDLAAVLLRRCTPFIRKHLRTLGPDALKEGHFEIVTRLFRRILDVSTNEADFLQVRFWVVMKRLCIQEFKRQLHNLKRDKNILSFSQLPTFDREDDNQAQTKAIRLTEEDKRMITAPPKQEAIIDRKEALRQLEEPFRSAFLLRYYEGWPIEDQDPAVPTISRHFGKTSRTIRNWLATADEILARWRGGQK